MSISSSGHGRVGGRLSKGILGMGAAGWGYTSWGYNALRPMPRNSRSRWRIWSHGALGNKPYLLKHVNMYMHRIPIIMALASIIIFVRVTKTSKVARAPRMMR